SCADCGHANPACSFPLPRISGRCNRRALYREPVCPGQCSRQAGRLLASCSDDGNALHGAPVHYSAAAGDEFWEPVLHPSSDRQEDRAADGASGGISAIKILLTCAFSITQVTQTAAFPTFRIGLYVS